MMVAVLLLPATASAQRAQRGDTLRHVSTVGHRLRFAVPASWGIFTQRVTDSVQQYVYYIRMPEIDSTADVSTNVIVHVRRVTGAVSFRAATDQWLSRMFDSTTIVLHDTLPSAAQRAVFWRSTDGSWIYLGFDDFALRGDRLIHIRIAEPLGDSTPASRPHRFETETLAFLQSVMFDGKKAFPAPVGFPAVGPGPPPHARAGASLRRPR